MLASESQNVFMFSGQGSQYFGMGRQLFDRERRFFRWMKHIDCIVQDYIGESLIDYIYSPKYNLSHPMTQLKITHPAIFMIEYSLAKCLIENGVKPDLLLGSSLGEYTCLALSEVLTLERAIELITTQAQIIERHCVEGAMLAVMGNHQMFLSDGNINQYCDLAAVNFDQHFIVSGSRKSIIYIKSYLDKQGITTQLLNVDYAFHSQYINPIADEYNMVISNQEYSSPCYPIYSCATGDLLNGVSKNHLWKCIRQPILFQNTIEKVDSLSPIKNYIDVGPSGTMATMTKYNISRCNHKNTYSIITMQGKCFDNYKYLLEKIMPIEV